MYTITCVIHNNFITVIYLQLMLKTIPVEDSNNISSINNISYPLIGKTVLLRIDFNLPIDNSNHITDYSRVVSAIDTIAYLVKQQAKVVLLSHFGQPKNGNNYEELAQNNQHLSFANFFPQIEKFLLKEYNYKLSFSALKIGSNELSAEVKNLKQGEILLLENIRFYPGEITNDIVFAEKISSLGDIYVNDAFSCSHRKHCSMVGIPAFIPSYVGFSLLKELNELENHLGKSFDNTFISDKKIITAIVGGKKISSKLPLIFSLSKKVDYLIIVGAMANTFLKANGCEIGNSFYEQDFLEQVRQFLNTPNRCKVIIPEDVTALVDSMEIKTIDCIDLSQQSDKNFQILDLGPSTTASITEILNKSNLVIWNGPAGYWEDYRFRTSTTEIASVIANLTLAKKIISVIGGGDTLATVSELGLNNGFSYISTGGGAFLEWLENDNLPGVLALKRIKHTEKSN